MLRRLSIVVVLLAAGAVARADDHVRTSAGAVDWTAGVMTAPGAAAGDLRAPSANVARVGAERAARAAARKTLSERARALVWADGDTVASKLDADPAAAARLADAVGHTLDRDLRYSTDGSVTLREALPLEAVRAAIVGPVAPPTPQDGDPTAVIVDATAIAGQRPALGLAIEAGDERYAGPTVYYRKGAKPRGDARLGPRVIELRATGEAGGVLAVDGDSAQVARLRKAGAVVVVVLPGSKS